jgi:hypothetical protein
MFDYEKFQRNAAAAVAALILSTTAVGAAVGPARAVETSPVVYAQLQAGTQANG